MLIIKKIIFRQFINIATMLLTGTLFFPVWAQDSSLTSSHTIQSTLCLPEVLFTKGKETIRFCFDDFTPQDDSCCMVSIKFSKYGINTRFNYTTDGNWICTGTSLDSNANSKAKLTASSSYNDKGILTRVIFTVDAPFDSARMELEQSTDIISQKDTMQLSDYEISRGTFICDEKIIYGKLVIRDYVYPAGYGEKGQILNYPERSAFHHGGSVRLPTGGGLLEIRAYMMNYWHIQQPLPIVFDDPEKIRKYEAYLAKWRSRNPPREKKVRQRKPFFKIKSL
ncbi:MAG: hypothetical protein JW915_14440 [Chitinispirillaceae bacterium]|nr:hypothetical protein [Chitinispirillaceae bacterium]